MRPGRRSIWFAVTCDVILRHCEVVAAGPDRDRVVRESSLHDRTLPTRVFDLLHPGCTIAMGEWFRSIGMDERDVPATIRGFRRELDRIINRHA